jgi:hypothetical protein
MQVCQKHSSSDNMWWDPSAAAIGSCSSSNHTSCGHRMRCRKGDTPAAAGIFKGHSHVVNAAKERHAAHCLTCRDKMDRGLFLFEPARLQEGRVAGGCTNISLSQAAFRFGSQSCVVPFKEMTCGWCRVKS